MTYLLPRCTPVNFALLLLMQLVQAVHRKNQYKINLSGDIVVNILELIRSSTDTGNVRVQRQDPAILDVLRSPTRSSAKRHYTE